MLLHKPGSCSPVWPTLVAQPLPINEDRFSLHVTNRMVNMFIRSLVLAALFASNAALADGNLPSKMQGKWTSGFNGAIGDTVIELIKTDGPEKANVKLTMIDAVDQHCRSCNFGSVETVAEMKDGAWRISAPSLRCASYVMVLKPVEGKRRFEGTFTGDVGCARGTIFYEWAAP